MKIGPVEIRVHALVYLGLIAVMIIGMLTLWRANSVGRLETFYRNSITLALNESDKDLTYLEEQAEACRNISRLSPEKVSPKLYLGSILLRMNKAADAMAAFNEVGKMNSATPEEKVMAEIGAAVALFRATSGDEPAKYAEAAVKCEPLFQQIVEKNPGQADALADLALAKALQKPDAAESVKPLADQALAAKVPPTLATLEQLHCLQGLIAYQQGKPLDSYSEYIRAQALQPFATNLGDNQRYALLASILKKDTPAQVRIKSIRDVEHEQGKFSQKQIPILFNGLGYSRSLLKDEPDFVKAYFDTARGNFTMSRTIDTKFSPGYRNLAALFEDRIAELAKTLSIPITGINGESPQPNPWTSEQKQLIQGADQVSLSQINSLLKDEEAVWDSYVGQAAQTPEEKIDARIRQLACVRRLIWTMPGDTGQSHFPKALALGKELITLGPKDALAHFSYGEVLLDKGDKGAAFKEFETAKSLGMNTTASNRLVNALSGKAELVDLRPATSLRIFGSKALFRCTLRGIDMSSVKDFIMKVDGVQVEAVRWGSQILFVPQETQVGDGKHVVKIIVNLTGVDEPKEQETEFFVNKRPPSWSVTPAGPELIATQPTWTITLEDVTGIDRPTLKVTLKKAAGGFMRDLVKDGRYRVASDTGKANTDVKTEIPFKVTTGADVAPGDYMLEISVSNMAGIPLVDSKKYIIK